MDISKEQYWKNRKAGLRGQGEYANVLNKVYTPEEWQKLKDEERKHGKKTGK